MLNKNKDRFKIIPNKDKKIYNEVTKSVKENDGYCPCMIEKNNDTLCPCKIFREMESMGECHCGRYEKIYR